MNLVIAIVVGAVLGVAGTVAGVAAYQGSPHQYSQVKLYSYADN